MKTTTLYAITVPVFTKHLKNLSALLEKAEAFAAERKFSADLFLADRLAVDQFSLVKQIQIACDTAKGTAARIAKTEMPKMEDAETTIAELQTRIAKTVEFLETIAAERINGNEEVSVPIYFMPGKALPALEYVLDMALPNFFFHCTTAYSILRKNGVIIGKEDFIGPVNFRDEQ